MVLDSEFVLQFDYWVRLINLPISIFGVVINIYHLRILAKDSIRHTPVFIIMMVICMSDLVQLVGLIANDTKYVVIFNLDLFCPQTDTYYGALLTLVYNFVNGFTIFVSSWMVVMMAFFRSLSIKFAMSSFSEFFSKASTARKLATVVITTAFFYNLLSCFSRYSIVKKNPLELCDSILNSSEQFFYVSGSARTNHATVIFTFFDGIIQLFQVIFFTYSTVFLARFIREASSTKMMRDRESRETERTEGLILFTLIPFFLFMFPMIVSNFSFPIYANFSREPYALLMTDRILKMLQTINASSHCIVCIFMSSQYRDAAKIKLNRFSKVRHSISG